MKTGLGEEWLTRSQWLPERLEALGLSFAELALAVEEMTVCCRDAWTTGLLRGFNGNMSLRLAAAGGQDLFLVTGTGVAKGHIRPGDLALCDKDGSLLVGAPLSSETGMHMGIYRVRPGTRCVLHTHPAALLALSLRVGCGERFLNLPIIETVIWLPQLGLAHACPAGSRELAEAVAKAFEAPGIRAVFMERHGLCVAGQTAIEVLGVSEELEHMAQTQLLAESGQA